MGHPVYKKSFFGENIRSFYGVDFLVLELGSKSAPGGPMYYYFHVLAKPRLTKVSERKKLSMMTCIRHPSRVFQVKIWRYGNE